MPQIGDDAALSWRGGLSSSLHETQIAEDEIADGSDWISRDGILQLDRRYILKAQVQDAALTPQGSGWGRYGLGPQSEQYVAVLDGTMYLVDLRSGQSLSFTPVIDGGGLAAGDWWFAQVREHLYGAHIVAGVGRKLLAPGLDGTGDWRTLRSPQRGSERPSVADVLPLLARPQFTGGSTTGSTGFSTITLGSENVQATSSTGGAKELIVTFDTSPDQRPDWSRRDILHNVSFGFSSSNIPTPTLFLVLSDGSEVQAILWREERPVSTFAVTSWRLQHMSRTLRASVLKLVLRWNSPSGTNTVDFFSPDAGGVWMSQVASYNPGFNQDPLFSPFWYVYTYFDSDSGLESPISNSVLVDAAGQYYFGQRFDVSFPMVPEAPPSGATHIRLYRSWESGGVTQRARLVELPVTGTPQTFRDHYTLDELDLLPRLSPGEVPTTGITALAHWQGRLVIALSELVKVSRDDDPLKFEPITGPEDPIDPARGLTFYADNARADRVVALIPREPLYMVGEAGVYALYGTDASNWRLEKLPTTEGTVGPRAACAYRNGVLYLTPSGRLLYVQVGQDEPDEVSNKVRARIGNLGMKALATPDAVVGVRPDGQIEVKSGHAYYVLDTDGAWRKGRHTDATHSLLYVPTQPIRWLSSEGKLMEGGADAFVTDGGLIGDDGTEIEFYVDTGKWPIQRVRLKSVNWGNTPEVVENAPDGQAFVRYPVLEFIGERTTRTAKEHGRRHMRTSPESTGDTVQFRIRGNKDTPIEQCRLFFTRVSPARHQ